MVLSRLNSVWWASDCWDLCSSVPPLFDRDWTRFAASQRASRRSLRAPKPGRARARRRESLVGREAGRHERRRRSESALSGAREASRRAGQRDDGKARSSFQVADHDPEPNAERGADSWLGTSNGGTGSCQQTKLRTPRRSSSSDGCCVPASLKQREGACLAVWISGIARVSALAQGSTGGALACEREPSRGDWGGRDLARAPWSRSSRPTAARVDGEKLSNRVLDGAVGREQPDTARRKSNSPMRKEVGTARDRVAGWNDAMWIPSRRSTEARGAGSAGSRGKAACYPAPSRNAG